MKKILNKLVFIIVLYGLFITGKAQDVKNYAEDINKMYPAAPSSNNLMKFEEVPVSNYTGIPDISIPLTSIPTVNPNVNLNIGLKYHPLSAKPEDRASETGLGWSLIAGGSITRTVRGGCADEKNRTFLSNGVYKMGIYHYTEPNL